MKSNLHRANSFSARRRLFLSIFVHTLGQSKILIIRVYLTNIYDPYRFPNAHIFFQPLSVEEITNKILFATTPQNYIHKMLNIKSWNLWRGIFLERWLRVSKKIARMSWDIWGMKFFYSPLKLNTRWPQLNESNLPILFTNWHHFLYYNFSFLRTESQD